MSRDPIESRKVSFARLAILSLILAAGFALVGAAASRMFSRPAEPPNVAAEAEKYLRFYKGAPLAETQTLTDLLDNPDLFVAESEAHPLLGKRAPDFELGDHTGAAFHLSEQLAKGPVILVFYYGYWCDHCVAQLFGIDEDIGLFRKLGAEVVAVSADPPEMTAERFEQYGAFGYPVLSDPDKRVAAAYGVFRPANGDTPERLEHATFVIDSDGVVRWAEQGPEPFLHNQTLLYELGKLRNQKEVGSSR